MLSRHLVHSEDAVLDTDSLLTVLVRFIDEILEFDASPRSNFRINTIELVFGLAATSLVAVQQQIRTSFAGGAVSPHEDSVHEALSAFSRFIVSEKANIQLMGDDAHAHPEETLIINRVAAKSIVESLAAMAGASYLTPTEIDLVGVIARDLTDAFSEREAVYEDVFPSLELLRSLCPVPKPAYQPSVRADSTMTEKQSLSEEDEAKISPSAPANTGSVYGDKDDDEMLGSSDDLLRGVPSLSYDEVWVSSLEHSL